jgi:hypothetical protein
MKENNNANNILHCIRELKKIKWSSELDPDHPTYLKWAYNAEAYMEQIKSFLLKYHGEKIVKQVTILIRNGDIASAAKLIESFIERQEQKEIIIQTVLVILWGVNTIPFHFIFFFIGFLGMTVTLPITLVIRQLSKNKQKFA